MAIIQNITVRKAAPAIVANLKPAKETNWVKFASLSLDLGAPLSALQRNGKQRKEELGIRKTKMNLVNAGIFCTSLRVV